MSNKIPSQSSESDRHLTILIDTDCGIDDAQALIAALQDKKRTEIIAITTVSGNTGLDQATFNVCACLDAVNQTDIPVFKGCSRPLVEPVRDAADWHGFDGLGESGLGELSNKSHIQEEHAVLAIIRLAKEYAKKDKRITLVTLGPLTNIAMAFRLDSNLSDYVEKIVIMGGAYAAHGNVTLCAEFNAHCDPESFAIVLEGFPRIQLVTWELTLCSGLSQAFCNQWLNDSTITGRFLTKISHHLLKVTEKHSEMSNEEYKRSGFYIPDPLAMSIACRPECIKLSRTRQIMVELSTGHARGMTIVNQRTRGIEKHKMNVEIIEQVDMSIVETFLLASTTS